jgi:uncharacterized membrane protein YfcA
MRIHRLPTTVFSAGVALAVFLVWYFTTTDPFQYFRDHWQVSISMIFGSLIAGSTSEGGGAVAFPVFTKLLHIPPAHAKVFSLAIQSVGMTAASLTIIYARIPVEWRAIGWAGLGGVPGILLGSALLAPLLPPPLVKLSFTAMATSFAVVLLLLNLGRTPRRPRIRPDADATRLLLEVGFIGGIMSGLVGNGIDLLVFSVLVLRFRVSEKVATPTSVILMALNALVGFALHGLAVGGFNEDVRAWWLAAVPVVVVGAPLGALFCSRLNRRIIAWILIGLIFIEFATSLWLIPITPITGGTALAIMLLFALTFLALYRIGVQEVPAISDEQMETRLRAGRTPSCCDQQVSDASPASIATLGPD